MSTLVLNDHSPRIQGPEELTTYFRKAEKSPDNLRLGTEHEKFGFVMPEKDGLPQPVPFEGNPGIEVLLGAMRDRFGWQELHEAGRLISLTRQGGMISLEPGGQFELSGAIQNNAWETAKELATHKAELDALNANLAQSIRWLLLGRNPFTPIEHIPWMPKARYQVMGRYLPTQAPLAHHMMLATSSTQVSLDFTSEADMARKMRLGFATAPVFTALSANSPFAQGRPTGYQSTRAHIWTQTDPARCGLITSPLGSVFSNEFNYAAYVEWVLDVPMFFIHREGQLVDMAGHSFRRFLAQGYTLPNGQKHEATWEDWLLHLTTVFPDVRLKTYVEFRTMDVGSLASVAAFTALLRGLLYDERALNEALTLMRDFRAEHYAPAMAQAAKDGLQGQMLGRPLLEWARDVVAIGKAGLERLGAKGPCGARASHANESPLLAPLEETLDRGLSPAAHLLARYHGEWGGNLQPLLNDPQYWL